MLFSALIDFSITNPLLPALAIYFHINKKRKEDFEEDDNIPEIFDERIYPLSKDKQKKVKLYIHAQNQFNAPLLSSKAILGSGADRVRGAHKGLHIEGLIEDLDRRKKEPSIFLKI